MAFTNIGYAGSVTTVEWAKLSGYLGGPAVIVSGLAVTAVSGGTRQVSVSGGSGYAGGVLASQGTAQVLSHAAVTTGTRWDTVALRFNWGTSTTTLVVVAGGAAQALAGGLNTNPGVSFDLPIALVQINAGQTAPAAIVQLGGGIARTRTVVVSRAVVSAEADDANIALPAGEVWPNFSPSLSVTVPGWARNAAFQATWHGVRFDGTNFGGNTWIKLGPVTSSVTRFDAAGGGTVSRETLGCAGNLAIPDGIRGSNQSLVPYGGSDVGSTNYARIDGFSSFAAVLTFSE